MLKAGPSMVCRTKDSTLPRRLSNSQTLARGQAARPVGANAVSQGLILGRSRACGETRLKEAHCCHHRVGGMGGGSGRPGGALGYLLWGEEETLSGPLSSISSRMESGWSRRLRNQPCFLNTRGWARPFNPPTPQGSYRKKTVAFGLETLQQGCSLGHFCSAQNQTEDKNIVIKATVFYNGLFQARESGLVIILYPGNARLEAKGK